MNSINIEIFSNNIGLCNKYCLVENLQQLIKKTKQFGIDYYQSAAATDDTNSKFLPTLFYGAQIIDDDDDFTPVVTILPYRSITEAVALANNTKYGLAASIWSETESIIKEIYHQLQVN